MADLEIVILLQLCHVVTSNSKTRVQTMKKFMRAFASVLFILISVFGVSHANVWDTPKPFLKSEVNSQQLFLEVNLETLLSNGDFAPFWTFQNRQGLYGYMPKGGHADVYAKYSHRFSQHHQVEAGLGVAYTSNRYPKAFLHKFFVSYTNPLCELWIGAKPHVSYPDLIEPSVASGSLAFSNNAPPIPSLGFKTNGFLEVPFTKNYLSFYLDFTAGKSLENAFINHYAKDVTKSFVEDISYHTKSFYLRIGNSSSEFPLLLTLGGIHAAQWGGNPSYKEGELPHTFKDFLRVVMGKSGGETASTSDQINALGNQFGQYYVGLSYESNGVRWNLYHKHYFEDKSGIEWNNGPDGLWGISYQSKKKQIVSEVVLEYLTTMNQSGPFHIIRFDRYNGIEGRGGGADNYYNNGEYPMGLLYNGYNIGNPLMLSPLYNEKTMLGGFRHNRVQAYHLGILGHYTPLRISYEMKLSNIKSYGSINSVLPSPLSSTVSFLRINYNLKSYPSVTIYGYGSADFGTLIPDSQGVGIGLKYIFN